MKFSEKYLINIYNLFSSARLNRIKAGWPLKEFAGTGSPLPVLRRGVNLLNGEVLAAITSWLLSQQTREGGFSGRAGQCDLYYTLFGYYLAEALELNQVFPSLKTYVGIKARERDHTATHLFCMAILNASLYPDDTENKRFATTIRKMTAERSPLQNGYTPFLAVIALLSLHDYYGVLAVLKAFEANPVSDDRPCTVVAAQQIMAFLKTGKNCHPAPDATPGETAVPLPFRMFYREEGGFAALKLTKEPDLLSTAAALLVMRFMDNDLRLIRPRCLDFISGLYRDGGFSAVNPDEVTDVEYTFYGLLALGALNSDDEKN
jgi:hypothetical protein